MGIWPYSYTAALVSQLRGELPSCLLAWPLPRFLPTMSLPGKLLFNHQDPVGLPSSLWFQAKETVPLSEPEEHPWMSPYGPDHIILSSFCALLRSRGTGPTPLSWHLQGLSLALNRPGAAGQRSRAVGTEAKVLHAVNAHQPSPVGSFCT